MAHPEPWLRGPLPGIPALLQPAAHAFVMALEDVEAAAVGLGPAQLWLQPGGAASIGFHLFHLAGATDRLLTYARGEELSPEQRERLAAESTVAETRTSLDALLTGWKRAVEAALEQLRRTPEASLQDPRHVGRARLPSTVLGLLVHAAEHAARHTGQIVTTARILRSQP